MGAAPNGHSLVALQDFSGDGTADVMFLNQGSGQLHLWSWDGTKVSAMTDLMTSPTGWTPRYSGDINGDGSPDILMTSPTGALSSLNLAHFRPINWTDIGPREPGLQLVGCLPPASPAPAPTLQRLSLEQKSMLMPSPGSRKLQAWASYSDGRVVPVSPSWQSSAPAEVSVTPQGVVHTIAPSSRANITATYGGQSATTEILTDSYSQSITSLELPIEPDWRVGQNKTLRVRAVYSNGQSAALELDDSLTWTSSDPSQVAVTSQGFVTVLAGSANITVTHSLSGKSATAQIRCSNPSAVLSSLRVDPPTPAAAPGSSFAFKILADDAFDFSETCQISVVPSEAGLLRGRRQDGRLEFLALKTGPAQLQIRDPRSGTQTVVPIQVDPTLTGDYRRVDLLHGGVAVYSWIYGPFGPDLRRFAILSPYPTPTLYVYDLNILGLWNYRNLSPINFDYSGSNKRYPVEARPHLSISPEGSRAAYAALKSSVDIVPTSFFGTTQTLTLPSDVIALQTALTGDNRCLVWGTRRGPGPSNTIDYQNALFDINLATQAIVEYPLHNTVNGIWLDESRHSLLVGSYDGSSTRVYDVSGAPQLTQDTPTQVVEAATALSPVHGILSLSSQPQPVDANASYGHDPSNISIYAAWSAPSWSNPPVRASQLILRPLTDLTQITKTFDLTSLYQSGQESGGYAPGSPAFGPDGRDILLVRPDQKVWRFRGDTFQRFNDFLLTDSQRNYWGPPATSQVRVPSEPFGASILTSPYRNSVIVLQNLFLAPDVREIHIYQSP